jgi:hypothetical protein
MQRDIDIMMPISENGKHFRNFNAPSLAPEASNTFLQAKIRRNWFPAAINFIHNQLQGFPSNAIVVY